MSKSTTLNCECGCNATVTDPYECGWLTLSQLPPNKNGDDPKLDGELHFSSLKCLEKWARKAASVIPGLQKSARGLYPRGTLRNEEVLGLHI